MENNDQFSTPEIQQREKKEGGMGAMIGSIIIILIIVIGGVYLLNYVKESRSDDSVIKDTQAIPEENTDSTSDLEMEAEAMEEDLSEIDAELDAMEAEFDNI